MKRLVVIGAGPKALALHVKALALRELKADAPEVVIIERDAVGAHWAGGYGYTDGARLLCTVPQKDLSYPYVSTFGRDVDAILNRYSWPAFQIARGTYSSWVEDSAEGRFPDHREWTAYLRWAAEKSEAYVIAAEVERAEARGEMWDIRHRDRNARRETIQADGLVLTGPGAPKRLSHQDDDPRISDGRSFWLPANMKEIRSIEKGRIAVIGSGETAGTILCALLDFLGHRDVLIHCFTRSWPEARASNHWANEFLTDPSKWNEEPLDKRRSFINGTDKGKLSPRTHERLKKAASEGRVLQTDGYITHARAAPDGIELSGTDLRKPITAKFAHVVVAKGFDPLTTLKPVWPKKGLVGGRLGDRENAIARRIDFDLSVAGMVPKLHLPMFAAVEQGPGFPRLCCLGVLSDRILGSYI